MDFKFDGSISRKVLNSYLSRAVTHCNLLDSQEGASTTFKDDLRMLKNEGAKFIGRSCYVWSYVDYEEHFKRCKERAEKCHEEDSEFVLQCCVFECVTKRFCESIKIPEWVFSAFCLPFEDRNFSMDAMKFFDGKFVSHWGKETIVPDITTIEGQMWIYFMACSYINAGCEAIHFGQVWLIGARDKEWTMWDKIVGMVRDYAKIHARRRYVICDAHCHGLITKDGRSILDFNAFPVRLKEVEDEPMKCVCEIDYSDSIFGKSKGGIHPSGWHSDPFPFLVELDNWGRSKTPAQYTNDGLHAWGYDEITWFAMQPDDYRAEFLNYIHNWIKERYENGHMQMPSRRCMAGAKRRININPEFFNEEEMLKVQTNEHITIEDANPQNPVILRSHYSANTPSKDCPFGWGDEEVIKKIWSAE